MIGLQLHTATFMLLQTGLYGLGPIQTNLHNRINVCIKNLIGSFPYAFAYRPINFFMHTFMRLCKFVWIGPYGLSTIELRNNWRERKLNFRTRGVKPEK